MTEDGKNTAIEIHPASNGFFVRPGYEGPWRGEVRDVLVFQTFAELSAWLEGHFTFRQSVVSGDC